MSDLKREPLSRFVEAGEMVLVGEVHGANEFGSLVTKLVGIAVERQIRVVVGLELPTNEQDAINRFLYGDGGPDEIRELVSSDFWHRDPKYDDGRTGYALVDLLQSLRLAGEQGSVRIVAFDYPWVAPPSNVGGFSVVDEESSTDLPDLSNDLAGWPLGITEGAAVRPFDQVKYPLGALPSELVDALMMPREKFMAATASRVIDDSRSGAEKALWSFLRAIFIQG